MSFRGAFQPQTSCDSVTLKSIGEGNRLNEEPGKETLIRCNALQQFSDTVVQHPQTLD